jgi:hypothetical protein
MKLFTSAAVVHRYLNKSILYLNDRRNVHLEKLQNLYFSPHVVRMMKTRGWNGGM